MDIVGCAVILFLYLTFVQGLSLVKPVQLFCGERHSRSWMKLTDLYMMHFVYYLKQSKKQIQCLGEVTMHMTHLLHVVAKSTILYT